MSRYDMARQRFVQIYVLLATAATYLIGLTDW
jgi:hypothetical protein